MRTSAPKLLAIIELGGYPNFVPLYQRLGLEVELVSSQRRAQSSLRSRIPDLVVAEFNYQSDFRDRTSNLESLMARLQKHPETKVILFYQPEHADKLSRLLNRFSIFASLSYPIEAIQFEQVLRSALES